jgi:hypothetical protein
MNPAQILTDFVLTLSLLSHGKPSEFLLLRMNKETDMDVKYIHSYVLSTLHEKRKIKIYIITKNEQLKSETATDGTLNECEKRESLRNMDMLCRCSKVFKQNEQNTK